MYSRAAWDCVGSEMMIPFSGDVVRWRVAMGREELFEDLPAVRKSIEEPEGGRPRLREPERDQIELRAVDIDSLIGLDHPARVIWGYVERLDLSELEGAIRAREHRPGQAPASPRLLLALWLQATSEAVGSARALAKL